MSLINEIFNRIKPITIVYVRLKQNELEIKHMQTGNTLARKSAKTFSNDRLLIADFETAEEFLRELCDELLNQKNKFIKQSLGMVFQPVDSIIKIITPVERIIYTDFAHFSGAKYIWIVDHQGILSDSEVFEITTKKNKS